MNEEIKCYICKKSIGKNKVIYIGAYKGEKLYRHKKCASKLITKYKKIRRRL